MFHIYCTVIFLCLQQIETKTNKSFMYLKQSFSTSVSGAVPLLCPDRWGPVRGEDAAGGGFMDWSCHCRVFWGGTRFFPWRSGRGPRGLYLKSPVRVFFTSSPEERWQKDKKSILNHKSSCLAINLAPSAKFTICKEKNMVSAWLFLKGTIWLEATV